MSNSDRQSRSYLVVTDSRCFAVDSLDLTVRENQAGDHLAVNDGASGSELE